MTYNGSNEKISSFTQLRAWQNARELAVFIYKATETFPAAEKFGLSSQMRRSSVSVAANIAEGFSRHTVKDKINFYHMALGSLTETISHAYIAHDLLFLSSHEMETIINLATGVQKMTSGLMRTAQGRSIRTT